MHVEALLPTGHLLPERESLPFMCKGVCRPIQMLPVQPPQQLMHREVARILGNSHAQFLFGFGKTIHFHQRLAEQAVKRRLEVEETERLGGCSNRLFKPARLEM